MNAKTIFITFTGVVTGVVVSAIMEVWK